MGWSRVSGEKKSRPLRGSNNGPYGPSEGQRCFAPGEWTLTPGPSPGEEVKAYIVPAEDQTPQSIPPGEIIAYCRQRIAEFKIPRYIEYRKSFPATPTGKIEKHALAADGTHSGANCYDREAEK